MTAFDDLDADACQAVMDVFGGVEVVLLPREVGGGYTARPADPDRAGTTLSGVFTEGTEYPQAMSTRDGANSALSGAHATVWLPPAQAALLPYRPRRGDRVGVSARTWAVARVDTSDRGDMLLSLNEE